MRLFKIMILSVATVGAFALAVASWAQQDEILVKLRLDVDAEGLGTECLNIVMEEILPPKEAGLRRLIMNKDIQVSEGKFEDQTVVSFDRERDHEVYLIYSGCRKPGLYIEKRCKWRRLFDGNEVGSGFVISADTESPVTLEIIRECQPES